MNFRDLLLLDSLDNGTGIPLLDVGREAKVLRMVDQRRQKLLGGWRDWKLETSWNLQKFDLMPHPLSPNPGLLPPKPTIFIPQRQSPHSPNTSTLHRDFHEFHSIGVSSRSILLLQRRTYRHNWCSKSAPASIRWEGRNLHEGGAKIHVLHCLCSHLRLTYAHVATNCVEWRQSIGQFCDLFVIVGCCTRGTLLSASLDEVHRTMLRTNGCMLYEHGKGRRVDAGLAMSSQCCRPFFFFWLCGWFIDTKLSWTKATFTEAG